MSKLFSMSIRAQLFLVAFIIALPAAGIIIYSGVNLRGEALQDARVETQKLVDRIVTEQQNLAMGAEQLMAAVTQLPEVRHHEAAKVKRVLGELRTLNPIYSNIFIADRDGTVWATAVPVPPPFNVADRRYFRNALQTGQLSSGEYVVSRATAKPVFNFAYPVKDTRGDVVGVITVGVALDHYRQVLEHMQSPAGTSFVLIDHRGIILSRGINPEAFVGKEYQPQAFKGIVGGPDADTSVRAGIAGDRRIISYRKIRLKGEQVPYMYVTAGVPVDVALLHANKTFLNNVLFFMPVLVIALSLAWLIGKRSIVDRVALLECASHQLADGNLAVRVSDLVAGGELGRLGQTFDRMAHQLALRETALRESEKFLSTIIETEPECVKLLAADGSILMINRAGLDMVQVESFEQVKGKSSYGIVDPEYLDAFKAMIADVFTGKSVTLQFKIVGVKGRSLWLETHAVPLRNDAGEIVSLLGITLDITERIGLEQMKDDMISAVSHEMRTPLTAMLGYIEFMLENNVDELQTREYLGIVYKETDRLNKLIGNFLDMQRLRAKRGRHSFRQLEVRPLLEESATLFATASDRHRIFIDTPADLLPVFGDEEGLHQVLNNLLSNAIKYSPNGGTITLGARRDESVVSLWVKDEGTGIPQESLTRVFEKFYRVDNTPRRATSGTGLGLALVWEIVSAHGGTVRVESRLGEGSTFYVSLPAMCAGKMAQGSAGLPL